MMKFLTANVVATCCAAALMVGTMGAAHAHEDVAQCPAVADISATANKKDGGYIYKARSKDGKEWVGENWRAEAGDLASFQFTALFKRSEAKPPYFACDYEIPKEVNGKPSKKTGGVRMTRAVEQH